jgi:hypothetical protein
MQLDSSTVAVECTLPESWRSQAANLRECAAAEGAARALEWAANALDHWLAERRATLLTYAEAASLVGRSPSTIEKAVQRGRLANRGAKHRPRVALGEVEQTFKPRQPRIARAGTPKYDSATDVKLLLGARRGG